MDLAKELGGLAHGAGDERRVEDKASQLALGDGARGHEPRAKPKDDHDAAEEGYDEEGDKDRPPLGCADRRRKDARVGFLIAAQLESLV